MTLQLRRLAVVTLALALAPEARAQAPGGAAPARAVPFDGGWELSGEGTRIEAYQGRRALRMRSGLAIRRDVSLGDGTIEFDVAMPRQRAFVYVLFRMASDEEHEEIYLRPHKSGLPDAVQYAPVWRGESNWQLYHGRTGTASASFAEDAWMHVRLVLKGKRAALFLGEGATPALVVPLAREPARGYLALQSFTPKGGAPEGQAVAAFANVAVRPGHVPYDFGPEAPAAPPPGMITRWQVSPAMAAQPGPLADVPASLLVSKDRWPAFAVEDTGVLVIGRHVPRPAPVSAAIARLVLRAPADGLQRMDLGYSDYVTVFVNGRPLCAGDAHYSYQDPRQDGFIGLWQATVWLPLVRGDNEVLLAVVDGFGGWGLTARLEPADGALALSSGVADQKVARAQPAAADPESIVQMERDRQQAFVRGDFAALERATADDYTTISNKGRISNKPQMMGRLREGRTKVLSATLDDMKARVYGDTVVLTGRLHEVSRTGGEQKDEQYLFTRVFVKLGGRWQAVAYQQTLAARD